MWSLLLPGLTEEVSSLHPGTAGICLYKYAANICQMRHGYKIDESHNSSEEALQNSDRSRIELQLVIMSVIMVFLLELG